MSIQDDSKSTDTKHWCEATMSRHDAMPVELRALSSETGETEAIYCLFTHGIPVWNIIKSIRDALHTSQPTV